MKKVLYKLMAVCALVMPLAAAAQSTDGMKQDQSQRGQMKHDDMAQDQLRSGWCIGGAYLDRSEKNQIRIFLTHCFETDGKAPESFMRLASSL